MGRLRGTFENAVSAGRLRTDALDFPSKKLSRGVLVEVLAHVTVFPFVAICDSHMFALDHRGGHLLGSKVPLNAGNKTLTPEIKGGVERRL